MKLIGKSCKDKNAGTPSVQKLYGIEEKLLTEQFVGPMGNEVLVPSFDSNRRDSHFFFYCIHVFLAATQQLRNLTCKLFQRGRGDAHVSKPIFFKCLCRNPSFLYLCVETHLSFISARAWAEGFSPPLPCAVCARLPNGMRQRRAKDLSHRPLSQNPVVEFVVKS